MAANEITEYAAELRGLLAGVGGDATALVTLTMAAPNLATLAGRGPGMLTEAEWNAAKRQWDIARDAFGTKLAEALLGPLSARPGGIKFLLSRREEILVTLGQGRLRVGNRVKLMSATNLV